MWGGLVVLVLSLIPAQPRLAVSGRSMDELYTCWAVEAYPEQSAAESMLTELLAEQEDGRP